jgi:RNA polymerase sigma-70 factor, ECF subfamily
MYGRWVRGETKTMADRDPFDNPQALIRRVYGYVAYRIGDGPDAEDVTAETFERAVRYRHTYDKRRGEPVAWLIGIAARCLNDHFAKQAPAVGEVPELAAPGELAAEADSRVDLQRAVASLSAREREIVALRYGADLTAKQIAKLFYMRTNSVEVALHRALRALRARLEQAEAVPPSPSPAPRPAGQAEPPLRTPE